MQTCSCQNILLKQRALCQYFLKSGEGRKYFRGKIFFDKSDKKQVQRQQHQFAIQFKLQQQSGGHDRSLDYVISHIVFYQTIFHFVISSFVISLYIIS